MNSKTVNLMILTLVLLTGISAAIYLHGRETEHIAGNAQDVAADIKAEADTSPRPPTH
jgi:hypothetical protein